MPARPASRVHPTRGHLRGVLLLLLLLGQLGRARTPLRRHGRRTVRARTVVARHRGREQRRISPPSPDRAGIPVLGIEPARNIAAAAEAAGIPTLAEFLTTGLAREIVTRDGTADVVVANNVFAHVPDLNDFTAALRILLAPRGVLTIEVAHLVRLVEQNQFDTIYHEHFTYYAADRGTGPRPPWTARLRRRGARHAAGSLRFFVVHDDDPRPTAAAVEGLRARELAAGYGTLEGHAGFASRVASTKRDLLAFLIEEKRRGSRIAGYGAPGKANTLLTYCGIGNDFLDYLVDRNPHKHGRFTPGTHIPIHPPERLAETKPDVIVILPWNLRNEIADQLSYAREGWGARLVVPIPESR